MPAAASKAPLADYNSSVASLLTNTTQVFSIWAVNSNEFKRWLLKQGVKFENAKGSHVKLHLNGRQSVLPVHAKELKTGTVEGIKKQLGLKGK
jgi:mRNA interferase HicA